MNEQLCFIFLFKQATTSAADLPSSPTDEFIVCVPSCLCGYVCLCDILIVVLFLQSDSWEVNSEVSTANPSKRQKVNPGIPLQFKLTNDKQSITLPTPFPFPHNFPPSVECALRAKMMTPEAMKKFLATMARALYALKCYPTAGEYEAIGVQVIQRYPFMKSPAGCPYVS